MSRKCNPGIIEEICRYYQETEVPATFALWMAIFGVNECLGRDCSIDQGHFTVFPNMYIVIVAGSAKCRKSTAINVVTDFLRKVEPPIKILSQKMTPEAMISALSGTTLKDKTKLIEEAVGCFINDELSTLIDRGTFSSILIPVLTKLYDCKDFEYTTKMRGEEAVQNPCLSILGGSTIQWIKEAVPIHAIGGGFTSRIVFVYRADRDRKIAWPKRSQENVDREARIVHDLNEVARMRGVFGVTQEAIDLYTEEYDTFLEGTMSANPYLSGYAGRRHITLLKVAMAFSASRHSEREVTKQDIWKAIQALQNAEGGMDTVMRAITSEPTGEICEFIMTMIMTQGSIFRAKLVYDTRHRISHRELDVILEGLMQTGYVKRVLVDNKIAYKYVKKGS